MSLRRAGTLICRWRLAGRSNVLGFNLRAGTARLNNRLIAAHGAGPYRFAVHHAPTGRIVLHVVLRDGHQITVPAR